MAKFGTACINGMWRVKPYDKRLSAPFPTQFRPQGQDMAGGALQFALR